MKWKSVSAPNDCIASVFEQMFIMIFLTFRGVGRDSRSRNVRGIGSSTNAATDQTPDIPALEWVQKRTRYEDEWTLSLKNIDQSTYYVRIARRQ